LRRIIPAQRAGCRRGQDYKDAIWTRKAVLSESAGLYRLSLQDTFELDLQLHCEFNGKLDGLIWMTLANRPETSNQTGV